jgi:hypothetical protein
MEKPPTHLTCCFCPSQAFPRGSVVEIMQPYACPSGHVFYIIVDGDNKFENREEEK